MMPAGSYLARQADAIFFGMTAVAVVLLLGITGAMIWFVVRYRRSRNPVSADIRSHTLLEITWTVIPTILVLGMFYFGVMGFKGMRTVPPGAFEVNVTARMWSWTFTYENGTVLNELRIPVDTPVYLRLSSDDVLHSFFVPAFRIKEDTVPGLETYVWFQPERTGTYDIFCAEYCGVGHSRMLSKVVVMEQEEFFEWFSGQKEEEQAAGLALLQTKGCTGCHSLDGTRIVGPSFKGIFGRTTVVLTNGVEREITIDREYLRRSLLDPRADVVKGYPPVMPPQTGLTDEERETILNYLEDRKADGGR